MDLRTREQLKIHCGKKQFEALDNGIEMLVATDWHEIKARVLRKTRCDVNVTAGFLIR